MNGIQEQIAQAVPKWETDTCQPDTMMLLLIADYFQASADYLFYGEKIIYQDIYAKNGKRVARHPQMSREAYEEALKIFASAHHGISHGDLRGGELMYEEPSHISGEGGLSWGMA